MKLSLNNLRDLDINLGNEVIAFIEDLYSSKLPDNNADELRQLISRSINVNSNLLGCSGNKSVAILLSDLRGFTALSESYHTDKIINMLNRYLSHMNQVISRYGGVIDKYMGDAILVVFGLNEQNGDDLLRAIACAVEMQQCMDLVNSENEIEGLPRLFMGIGVNAGEVTAGALGSDFHQEYSIIGDEVNVVSRIEAHTLRGQILIGEKSYQQVAKHLEVGKPNSVQVKGKSEPLLLYEILSTNWPQLLEVPQREIRSGPRIEIDTPFQFQVLDGKTVLPELYQGRVKDLGYNGMFALFPKLSIQFTDIKLNLSASLISNNNKGFYGKIQIIHDMGHYNGCGVEFTAIDDDSQRTIKQFVDRLVIADGFYD